MVWGFDKVGQFQNYEEILHGAIHCDNRGNTQLLPGDYIYDDYNGDGVINGYDTKPIFRNKTPKLFYVECTMEKYGFDNGVPRCWYVQHPFQ